MRADLDHLPQRKHCELARVAETLFAEFMDSLKLATSRRHTSKSYMNDYDLLIMVNHKDLTDLATTGISPTIA